MPLAEDSSAGVKPGDAAQDSDRKLYDTAYPPPLREAEERSYKQRPKCAREKKKAGDRPDHEEKASEPPYLVGFGLSGGGIRSATFCLGVFQGLAKAPAAGREWSVHVERIRRQLFCRVLRAPVFPAGYFRDRRNPERSSRRTKPIEWRSTNRRLNSTSTRRRARNSEKITRGRPESSIGCAPTAVPWLPRGGAHLTTDIAVALQKPGDRSTDNGGLGHGYSPRRPVAPRHSG